MTGYAVDSIGFNPYAYANDAYFLQALNSPNFRASQSVPQVSDKVDKTLYTVPQAAQEEKNKSSVNGALLGTTIVSAAAMIYAAKKGKGNITDGFKVIVNKLRGKGTEAVEKAAGEKATEAVKKSDVLRAVYDKSGNLVFTVPGTNKTITGEAAVKAYAKKYGIDLKKLTQFNKNSKLTSYEFNYTDHGITNLVKVKDGKIVDIVNTGTGASVKDILNSTEPDNIKFVSKLEEKIANITNRTKGCGKDFRDLHNIEFVNSIGDDTVKIVKSDIKAGSPVTNMSLTTLDRLGKDSDPVLAYFRNNPEAKKVFADKKIVEGKLPDGMKIESFTHNYSGGIQCHFDGEGTLQGITKGGKYYKKGTVTCDAFLEREENTLEKMVENILKDDKIPEGARLIAA